MSGLVETFREIAGDRTRVVASLDSLDFDVRYIREDLEEEYSDSDLSDAYRLVMANQVSGNDFREILGTGEYYAQTMFFGDVLVCLFPSERYEVVFASFDYDEEFPVTELVARMKRRHAPDEGE